MSSPSNPYYQSICSEMTWSHSRLRSFEQCRYGFLLKYILLEPTRDCFYSSYGRFMHEIYERYYSGELTKSQLKPYFLSHFISDVQGIPPTESILHSYYESGRESLDRIPQFQEEIAGVEVKTNFRIGKLRFTGIADLVTRSTDGITVLDHKSHSLKPRSTKGKYTKSDEELDQYLRQLYLYTIPLEKKYKAPVKNLCFHCYRSGDIITEKFDPVARDKAIEWAQQTVEDIIHCEDFYPNVDYYFCKHLCDVRDSCDYYSMQQRR